MTTFTQQFDLPEVPDADSLLPGLVANAVFGFPQSHVVEFPFKFEALQRGVILVFMVEIFE